MFTGILCLLFNSLWSQTSDSCTYRNMDIKDDRFSAVAVPLEGEKIHSAKCFNLLPTADRLVLRTALDIPMYQNYNGIFINADAALNACAKYTLF